MESTINFRTVIADYLVAHPDAHLYFLLDHSGLLGLLRKLDSSKLHWVSLFDDTRESTALAVAPILVDVAVPGGPLPSLLLDWIAEHGAYSSVVTMLDSPLPFDMLQHRLAARLDIKLSEEMNAMLRFFDPRILAQLRETLTPEQADAFFSVASHWWFIDRAGKLVGFKTAYTVTDGAAAPLKLSQAQEFAMVDASVADQVLALLHKHVPNLMDKIPLAERYGFASQEVFKAKKEGLESIQAILVHVAKKLID
jgi:hypothetical protein